MAKYLDKDHYVLLKHSQNIKSFYKEYPDLEVIFNEYDDVTDELIKNLDPDIQNFFINTIPRLAKEAELEWEANPNPEEERGDNREDWVHCQLCNTKNKHVFYIYNKYNGNRLNVGSHCIKKFDILKNQGIDWKDYVNRIERVQKQNQLNKCFPGIITIVSRWNDSIDFCELILPYQIETPYLDLGKDIKEKVDYYVAGKCRKDDEEELFEEIGSMLEERKRYLIDINEHVEVNKDNNFAPKKAIRIWNRDNNDSVLIHWLKEEGVITHRTAHRITESNFMKTIADIINNSIQKMGFKRWASEPNQKGYIVACEPIPEVNLLCPHGEFIRRYGGFIFDDSNELPLKEDILKICSVADESSYYIISNALSQKVRQHDLFFYNHDYRFNEVVFYDRPANEYIVIDLKEFIKKYMLLAYGYSAAFVTDITEFIKSKSWKRFNRTDIDAHVNKY